MSEEKRRMRPDHMVVITEFERDGAVEECAGVRAPEEDGVSGGL